jgi:hypothetical protein
LELRELKERKVFRGQQEPQVVQLVLKGLKDLREPRVLLELIAQYKVLREDKELKVLRDFKDQQLELLEHKVLKGRKVSKELAELQA